MRPPSGSMVWWRLKTEATWHFGYCTYVSGCDLVRMGRWNGDSAGGSVVNISCIEWKPYT